MTEKLNNYFENAVKSLDISEDTVLSTPAIGIYDPVDIIIKSTRNILAFLLLKVKSCSPT